MVMRIDGEHFYLWRAVYDEGAALNFLVQGRRATKAAILLMRKRPRQTESVQLLVIDELCSYSAASRELGLAARHDLGPPSNRGLKTRTSRSDDARRPVRGWA